LRLQNSCSREYWFGFSEIVLDVKEGEFVSLEVSSFQLDLIENFKPATRNDTKHYT